MAELLYLVHRLPYPPNKGDKVRSYHLLKHLVAHHQVHLGTFIDDPEDEQHLPAVQAMCASVHAVKLHPGRARMSSLAGLLRSEPLTLSYYRSPSLEAWVNALVRGGTLQGVLVFSSSMAQYAAGLDVPVLVDFVDVDSAKWSDYAQARRWPMSWLYKREGRELLSYERSVVARVERSYFSTEKETELFRSLAPECAGRVEAMNNGVDFEYFSPDPERRSPFDADETPLVFTGAMDYWPNIDAVIWFAGEVLPLLRRRRPSMRLHIVGRSPSAAVQSLHGDDVRVTGTVPDVRPYLQHAAVVVAPLRLARGIQNKVLEAMAMGRPVVAAAACVDAIDATPGEHLLAARDAAGYVAAIERLLDAPALAQALGEQGRQRVQQVYSWFERLRVVDPLLNALPIRPRAA